MSRFPKIIKTGQIGDIPLHSDLGLDILIEEIYGCISESKVENDRLSSDRVKRQIDRWFFSFEKSPQIVSERQAVVAYALKNPAFIKAVDNLGLYPNQAIDRDDKFTRFTVLMIRFLNTSSGTGSSPRPISVPTSVKAVKVGPSIAPRIAPLARPVASTPDSPARAPT